jgi:Zn-dependent protease
LSDVNILSIVLGFAVLLVSLSIHEAAHAWVADRLGDPTARLQGRVSLNPVVHIDPIGTLVLPLIAMFSHLPIIGWAKPVPVNTRYLRSPRRDFMLVAAAGPASNAVQAVLAAIVLRAALTFGQPVEQAWVATAINTLALAVEINVLLALFNLIPVPPLDGGNVLAGLLPPSAAAGFAQLRRYGFVVLYALILTGALNAIIIPPTNLFMRLLLP